jgi:endo-1,3-1,4-beta-glycanase ExoK
MMLRSLPACSMAVTLFAASAAHAVSSAELYRNESQPYGRFEARIQFAAGDGVVSSFFLWKPGSEVAGTFWNELDFEKLGADCRMQTNPLYGAPVTDHGEIASVEADLCGGYHTYAFEWTPTYIAWLIDGVEVRREEGEVAAAFAENAATGMQIHFNVWPGDATFGGNFDPAILPVQQYVSWVQYSSFTDGAFALEWREDFTAGALPAGWAVGNWASPKNYSTHAPANVGFAADLAVLSLTADDATGIGGDLPPDVAGSAGGAGAGGAGGAPAAGSGGAGPGSGGSANGPASGGASSGGAASGGPANGPASGGATSGGAASGPAGAGAGPVLTPEPADDDGGCSLGTSRAGRGAGWAVLGLAAALAASRPRRWRRVSRR